MAIAIRTDTRLRGETIATVPAQLVVRLRHLRRARTLFEIAWEIAKQEITWPQSERETLEWERALEGTRQQWRAVYEGWEQTPSERAVELLVQAMAARQGEE